MGDVRRVYCPANNPVCINCHNNDTFVGIFFGILIQVRTPPKRGPIKQFAWIFCWKLAIQHFYTEFDYIAGWRRHIFFLNKNIFKRNDNLPLQKGWKWSWVRNMENSVSFDHWKWEIGLPCILWCLICLVVIFGVLRSHPEWPWVGRNIQRRIAH